MEPSDLQFAHTVIVRFTNMRTIRVRVVFEPWADEYLLIPGAEAVVISKGPDPVKNGLDIRFEEDSIKLWHLQEGEFYLYVDGALVPRDDYSDVDVPALPSMFSKLVP